MTLRIGKSLRRASVVAAAMVVWQVGAVNASAQATATSSPLVVTPGQPTTVTVTGDPGHYFAVVGSTTGSGFAYAGHQFAVGADVRILAMGNLDGNGQAVVQILPPFQGTALDRYYIQVATSRRRTSRRSNWPRATCS